MSVWSAERVAALDGYTIEWAKPGSFILSRRQRLYGASSVDGPLRPVGRVEVPLWKRVASRARAVQRALRFMFYNVIEASDGSLFVTFAKSVGVIRGGRYEPLKGLARPSRFLRGACAVARDGSIYLGEYLPNRDRGPMRVYRWMPGSSELEVVHEFSAGAIRHVHGIYYDRFDDCLWCVTGDVAHEARITRTVDFRTLETVGSGDETWRCVSLVFTREGIYYGMDAEFVPNGLYRIDRQSLERTRLAEVGGPVYYSHALDRDLFFAVTAELCPSQTDRSATLWHVGEDLQCSKVVAFKKDRLPVGPFMPGTIDFAGGPGLPDRFWFRGTGVSGADDVTFCVRADA